MRKLTLIAAGILAASGVSAGSFNLNNPQLNAMGGAGVGSSSSANPALITPGRAQNSFELNLGSVSAYLEDSQGFATSMRDFLEEDLDRYTGFDTGGLNTALTDLSNQITTTGNAAEDYEDDPSQANEDALRDELDNLSAQNQTTRGEVDEVDSLVRSTQDTFTEFSNRPVNFGFLAGLGLAMPRGNVPFAVGFNNNAYGGAQFQLNENDLSSFTNVTDDTDQFLDRVDAINNALQAVLDADTPEEREDALDDYNAAQATLNDPTDNNVYDNGEFQDDSLDIETSELESTVDILGANFTEVTLGSGVDFPNQFGNLSVGAVGKAQYILVFGEVLEFDDIENIDASFIQENTETYVTGNIDLGVSQTFDQLGAGTVAVGAVVKDVIPQTFESGDGREIEINPKVRAGISHYTPYSLVSVDIDVTENEPVGFGVPTRYLALGMELDAFGWAQVRAGFRNNLAVDDASVVSGGLGFSPWGANLNLSGWFKPNFEDEIDLALNSGFSADLGVSF